MKPTLALIAAFLMAFAWLLPHHYRPWVTYTGEALAFLALFPLALIFWQDKLKVPKMSWPILLLALVPLGQYFTGMVYFASKAWISSLYIFGFWLSIVIAYNLSLQSTDARQQLFKYFAQLLLSVAVVSGVIAVCQWLTIEQYFKGFMANLNSGRPYANFAQPNNMATFLTLGLLSALYLFETKKASLKILLPSAFILIFAIALSQSRTSWVALLCILIYVGYQQYRGILTIRWYAVLGGLATFILSVIFIPHMAALFADALDAPIKSVDLARRATGDMSRLAIWNQMLHAVMQQPWWGYGWHQTSVAYVSVSDTVQGPVWVKSAHNIVLDFILWNGVIIAVPFMAYFTYWLIKLQLKIESVESVIALLMLGAILVHALLEFPLFYSYFLLPFGFILGILHAQQRDTEWQCPVSILRALWVAATVLVVLIHRDYLIAGPKLSQSMKYEKQPEKLTLQQPIYLLSELDARIEWIRLNPYSKLSEAQLQQLNGMVMNYPTSYDLLKYARVLAYNGDEAEAKHQLWRLKTLRKISVDYQTLLDDISK